MKKLITLLALCLTLLSVSSQAQQTCNATFTWQFLNNTTVKFTPFINNDTVNLFHYWNFGDGGTSTLTSPTHTYNPTGSYLVKHVIYRQTASGTSFCTDSATSVITFSTTTPPPCTLTASFTKDSIAPLQYQFTNTSTGFNPADSIQWSFGDGSVSYAINPTHTYANAGNYAVCLRVKKALNAPGTAPCTSITCVQFYVSPPPTTNPCASVQPYFINDTIQTNVIQFTNQSTGTTANDSTIWHFGDGSSSTQANPTHTYLNAGTYNVCLVIKKFVTNNTFCIKEYCKTVVVTLPCNLLANFNWYRDSTTVNIYTYHFNNTTTPVSTTDSVRWSFGDGTFSNQYSPNHSYAQAGTYSVCLRMQKRNPNGILTNCVSEKCYQVNVTAPNACNLQVFFTQTIDSAQPNTIHFTNQSVNYASTDSIKWTFGDGTSSTQANPTHVYANAGTYNVCLIIKKNTTAGTTPCIREYCKTITIPQACTLVANYTYYRDTTTLSTNTYHFTNTSTGFASTDSIRWSFGDGTFSSQINPTHVYAQAGTYTACLRIIKRNPNGVLQNCVKEICKTITVPQACNIVGQFSSYADSVNRKKIYFTNNTLTTASTPIITTWSFGDGTTANTFNAVHEYAQPGRYYVCLRVQYGNCVSTKCDSITVLGNPPSCTQLSKYTFVRSATNPAVVTFTPNFVSADVQYTWTFGDGTGAQTATATHQFATAGYYTVCLTAYRNNNCASTTCNSIQILPNCNSITLAIADVRDSLVPNRVRFSVVGNTATTSQTWKITKIPTTPGTGTATINQTNPTYVFLDSGYYNVCVRATYANGCVKELCKTIYISQNMPTTNACTLQLYPNPASNTVTAVVTLVQPLLISATVYNSMNMQVAQQQQQGVVGNNNVTVNIVSLPAGIYTIRVLYGNQVCYATFIKQ